MKRILLLAFCLIGSFEKLIAQSFTVGQACRYQCFGTCDNIYQTYFGQHNGQRAYVFDSSQGNHAELACSIYSESTVLGSCYVEQFGLYYSGYAINITQVITCPLDSLSMLLISTSAVYGALKLMVQYKFN
ncbi:hypothetical protein [Pedobacter paludis]|uniref:Uncharacterized protein n=1 Tax=Pedobacter paludis TaxID=2203212 RepID=A0A317ETA0_9SPHI|nr:hypothetical protein [Pedobacter paludis]PWS29655.1 hypothetical protein DF947_21650 [Pedobacter paludis]